MPSVRSSVFAGLSCAGLLCAGLASATTIAQDPTRERWLAESADQRAERRARVAAIRAELRRLDELAERSPIVWQDGHGDEPTGFCFSPDGKRILTWARDGLVRMWDAWTGENLGFLGHHSAERVAVSFSPNGEWVLVFDQHAARATLWDGRSGEFVGVVGTDDAILDATIFSPDSRSVTAAGDDGIVRLWNVARGEFRSEPVFATVGIASQPGRIQYSPDGESLLLAGKDWRQRFFDTRSGELRLGLGNAEEPAPLGRFSAAGDRFHGPCGPDIRIWSVDDGTTLFSKPIDFEVWNNSWSRSVSDDARLVALTSFDGAKATVELWDVDANAVRHTLDAHSTELRFAVFSSGGRYLATGAERGHICVWDCESGARVLDTGPVGPDAHVHHFEFSPDGQRLWARWPTHGRLALFSVPDGRLLDRRTFHGTVYSFGFGPDGERTAAMSHPTYGLVHGPGRQTLFLTGHATPASGIVVSADGSLAASGASCEAERYADTGFARIWDPATGADVRTLAGVGNTCTTAFSPDGARIAVGGTERHAGGGPRLRGVRCLYDVRTGTRHRTLGAEDRFSGTGAFSPDGSRVLMTHRTSGHAWLHDAASGAVIRDLRTGVASNNTDTCDAVLSRDGAWIATTSGSPAGAVDIWDGRTAEPLHALLVDGRHEQLVRHMTFGPGDRLLATSSWDESTKIWETGSWALRRTLPHGATVWHSDFSPDGTRLVTACLDGAARIWDLEAPAPPTILREHAGPVRFAGFSPDGRFVVTCSDDGTARTWDAATGARVHVLEGHTARVLDAVFVPNSTRVITRSNDATVRIWDYDAGTLLLTRVMYGADDWLAFVPSGHYVGTERAAEWARVVVHGRSFPLSSYATVFHDPAKVKASMAGETVRPPTRLQSAPEVVISDPTSGTVTTRTFDLGVLLRDQYGFDDAGAVQIVQDGRELPAAAVDPRLRTERRAGRAVHGRLALRLEIPGARADTTIRVRATNVRGIRSRPVSARIVYEPPRRDLYVLGLAVSDYDDDELDLKYPGKDLADLVERLRAQEGTLFRTVHARSLLDREVTDAALKRLRREFLGAAGADDAIVVFVAGHGVRPEADEYYFLTPGATPDDPYEGIARSLLDSLVTSRNLHARSRVLLIDTCHAGEAFEGDGRRGGERGPRTYSQKTVDQEARGGLYILAASTDVGFAREQQGNGLFTRSLLDGLEGRADREGDGDGLVEIDELMLFVKRRVIEQSKGRQEPTIPRIEGGLGFPLARVRRDG